MKVELLKLYLDDHGNLWQCVEVCCSYTKDQGTLEPVKTIYTLKLVHGWLREITATCGPDLALLSKYPAVGTRIVKTL
jgi:hypothetical protein